MGLEGKSEAKVSLKGKIVSNQQVFNMIKAHEENKNNPHGVTAAQAGAIGYKRALTFNDDLNNITEDGVYVYSVGSVPQNAPFNDSSVVMVFGGNSANTQKVQIVFHHVGIRNGQFRTRDTGDWLSWMSIDGFVPDVDYSNCFSKEVYNTEGVVRQDWINPPMLANKLYRTLERFDGKSVYMVRSEFGTLPSNGVKTATFSNSAVRTISFEVTITNSAGQSFMIPYIDTEKDVCAVAFTTGTGISIKTTKDLTDCTAVAVTRFIYI